MQVELTVDNNNVLTIVCISLLPYQSRLGKIFPDKAHPYNCLVSTEDCIMLVYSIICIVCGCQNICKVHFGLCFIDTLLLGN